MQFLPMSFADIQFLTHFNTLLYVPVGYTSNKLLLRWSSHLDNPVSTHTNIWDLPQFKVLSIDYDNYTRIHDITGNSEFSYVIRVAASENKTIRISETKGADQLCSNCTADQRLCFRYTNSTITLLLKSEISSIWPASATV